MRDALVARALVMTGAVRSLTGAVLVLTGAVLVLTGCGNPCTGLAERTCARVGRGDPLCAELQAVAADPKAEDRKACEAGVAFVDELEKR